MPEQPQRIGAVAFREKIEWEGKIPAARLIVPQTETEEQANYVIRYYAERLLATGTLANMAACGHLIWGPGMFNVKPRCVRMVLKNIYDYQKIIVFGGAAQGKSFSGIAWLLLRWLQDPQGTTIKVMSVTGKHTESNIFGTLKMLHENTLVPMAGFRGGESISFTEGDKRAAISIVRVHAGDDNSEVLQGFHPLPRKDKHPLFGDQTAVMAVMDECEGIPNGVWTGVSNMLSTGDKDHVKVMCFYNPKDITAKPAQLAEPRGGWGEFDVETGVQGKDEWDSREGWRVVRLDPKKSENVLERKEVHKGFQTYEKNREYETKDGGNSQHLYVFGRGAYPPDSAVNTVTPQRVITQMRGEFTFVGQTVKYGSCDVAIDGRDEAVFSVGRYGHATAFKRVVIGPDGQRGIERVVFKNARKVAQLDQQFALPKGSTEIVASAIKKHCLALQIAPENFLSDASGNGEPVYILLHTEAFWSTKVRGVRFGEPATNLKMLDEDVQLAVDQYDGNVSEVLFAITRWGEAGCLAVAPTVQAQELEREIGGRRYVLGPGQTLKVEDKKEYKKRLSRSPDWGDSFAIWLHAIRTGGKVEAAALVPDKPKKEPGLQFDAADIESISWVGGGDSSGF